MEKISYKLPAFEGPLDLLLYLLSKNKVDIYQIQISELLEQYIQHIGQMQEQQLDIASEFLEMAAKLVYIKSVSLLPKYEEAEEMERDLAILLLEYQECQKIAKMFSEMVSFDKYVRQPQEVAPDYTYQRSHQPDVLLQAYINVVGKNKAKVPPSESAFNGIVKHKIVSVSSRIVFVLHYLKEKGEVEYDKLYENSESRSEMVATFLAVLELIKGNRIMVEEENDITKIKIIGGAENWEENFEQQ